MSNKSNQSEHSNQARSYPHPSGLIRALDSTGRVRGSSATPALEVVSPSPQRQIQSLIASMDKASFGPGSAGGSSSRNSSRHGNNASPAISNRSQSSQGRQAQGPNTSSTNPRSGSGRGPNTSSTVLRSGSGHDQNSSFTGRLNPNVAAFQSSRSQINQSFTMNQRQPTIVNMASQEFHTKIRDLVKKIEDNKDIDESTQESFVKDVRMIARHYDEQMKRLQEDYDRVWAEKQKCADDLDVASEQMNKVLAERDLYGKDRDSLRRSHENLKIRAQKSLEKLESLVQYWREKHDEMVKQLDIKNAQLDGKRAFRLGSNPSSSARRDKTLATRDSYKSPSAPYTAAFENTRMGSMGGQKSVNSPVTPKLTGLIGNSYGQSTALGHINPFSGPPNATAEEILPTIRDRRPVLLPMGRAPPGTLQITPDAWMSESSRVFNTEPGDTPRAIPHPSSTVLVLHSLLEDPSPYYQDEFAQLYVVVEGWAQTYCDVPHLANDQAIARSNQQLWAFMMNCTYPGQRQDAHTHVMALLNDPVSRPWFVMRMGVSYIVDKILSLEPYKKFSPTVNAELADVTTKLGERGLANEARQKLIDRRAAAIQGIFTGGAWDEWRTTELALHSKRLREIMGSMMNDSTLRSVAGGDLGALILKAWDLSLKINTAPLTFQILFPETAGKFNASTMIAKDKPWADPMQLQIKQTRLKLVITPVVTMRDDRTKTIRAKNLHNSNVLTMN